MSRRSDSIWNSTAFWSEPAQRAFAKARLRGIRENRRRRTSSPRVFDESSMAAGRLLESEENLRDIPIDAIVGSVGGRGFYFTASFHPKNDVILPRWKRAYARLHGLQGYDPIEVYEVDGTFFVVDGHFRVSVALALGFEAIQAKVRRWM